MEIKFYIVVTVVVLFLIHIYMVKKVDYTNHPFIIMMVLGGLLVRYSRTIFLWFYYILELTNNLPHGTLIA